MDELPSLPAAGSCFHQVVSAKSAPQSLCWGVGHSDIVTRRVVLIIREPEQRSGSRRGCARGATLRLATRRRARRMPPRAQRQSLALSVTVRPILPLCWRSCWRSSLGGRRRSRDYSSAVVALFLMGAQDAMRRQAPGLEEEEKERHDSSMLGECGMGLEQPDNDGQEQGRESSQTGPSRTR
jgi:hypothetical protein